MLKLSWLMKHLMVYWKNNLIIKKNNIFKINNISNENFLRFKFKMNNNLNNETKDMLVGCILGDAHIGKVGNNKAFITFEQTIKHKEYVFDIYNKLSKSNIKLNDIKYYSRKDSRYNSLNSSIYFKTHNSELLYPFVNMFLSETNVKILPLDIEMYLNPITLAYWICDDGQQVKRGGVTLCTDNYTLAEVEVLIKALSNRYNLKCSIHKKKGKSERIYNRIYIKKDSLDILKPLIIPYIHTSFLYKINS